MVDDRAVALVALFLGVAGLLATLVPPLRLPGMLVGLMAATLGVVAVACRGLGGKTIGAVGFLCGLTAMPVALFLYLASVDDARRVEECLRIFPDQVSACSSAG